MFARYFIHVRNIPWTVSHFDLEKHFATFGKVKHARVLFNKFGLSTGQGFVEFDTEVAMQHALNKTHILEDEELIVKKTDQRPVESDTTEINNDESNFIDEKF